MMKKLTVSILGAGQMGSVCVKILSDYAELFVYDVDFDKVDRLKSEYGIHLLKNLDELRTMDIILMALPKSSIIDFFHGNYGRISPNTICVNLCSFITLNDMIIYIRESDSMISPNLVSCKLIGHFNKMISSNTSTQFIVDHNCESIDKLSELVLLLSKLGNVTMDKEERYMDLNLMVAAEAMKSILVLEKKLNEMKFPNPIIQSALKNVFIGTADQYPYDEIDYFLEKVCDEYQDIPKLLKRSV